MLRPGDRVRYDGADHQVVALSGTSVRLHSDDGAQSVVLVAYLMACPEFSVVDGEPLPAVEPFGLLDGLPPKVLEDARTWERNIVEVETGLPPNPPLGASPRPGFDPATTTVAERDRAKALELGVSLRTMQIRRARYARQGLLSHPARCPARAAPPRVVGTGQQPTTRDDTADSAGRPARRIHRPPE